VCGTLAGVLVHGSGKEKAGQKKVSGHKISALLLRGELTVAGDSNGTIFVLQKGEEVHHKFSHNGAVTGLGLQGELLVSAGLDRRVLFWDMGTEKRVREEVDAHRGGAIVLACGPRGVASGGNDGVLRAYG
jgi:hypothetical protein